MIGMQYRVALPTDYDMAIIRARVAANGNKTDGFPDLKWKAYLVTEAGRYGNWQNEYAPLYLWRQQDGMNRFLFEGFYDNILKSFGWQQINIGVPLLDETTQAIGESAFVALFNGVIKPTLPLKSAMTALKKPEAGMEEAIGRVVFYNPDKWQYADFYFLRTLPPVAAERSKIYEVLHVSQ